MKSKSCFFLDTHIRSNKKINSFSNKIFIFFKCFFLFISLMSYNYCLSKYNFNFQIYLLQLCGYIFIGRIYFQVFCIWNRIIGINEVFIESGLIIPISLISLSISYNPHPEGHWTLVGTLGLGTRTCPFGQNDSTVK